MAWVLRLAEGLEIPILIRSLALDNLESALQLGSQYWHPPPLANANASAGHTAWDVAQAQGLNIEEPRPHYAPRNVNGGCTLPIHPSIPELQNSPECSKCQQYKQLAGDAVAKIQAIWECATLLETAKNPSVLSKELNVPSALAPALALSPELKYPKTVENNTVADIIAKPPRSHPLPSNTDSGVAADTKGKGNHNNEDNANTKDNANNEENAAAKGNSDAKENAEAKGSEDGDNSVDAKGNAKQDDNANAEPNCHKHCAALDAPLQAAEVWSDDETSEEDEQEITAADVLVAWAASGSESDDHHSWGTMDVDQDPKVMAAQAAQLLLRDDSDSDKALDTNDLLISNTATAAMVAAAWQSDSDNDANAKEVDAVPPDDNTNAALTLYILVGLL
ncbi:hypothetical protein B0H34DRAFT_673084 [Crassisporium funariophilum]|nr:hypothetical protein B0H34DRAFT_673084 [Crassisporium funariophilum]